MKRPNLFPVYLVVLLVISLPALIAGWVGASERVFAGLLYNPFDGASYLAKMYQGWSGAWRFTLPFTAEPGEGAYLFLYYLFLGHLARWTGLSLIWVFHLARLAGAALLLLALYQFYARVFPGRADLQRIVFWLSSVGSGMGWLIIFLDEIPTDFFVAEAYPFLSMYVNPHFPLGLAILLWCLVILLDEGLPFRCLQLMVLGLALSIILPFAVVVAVFLAGGWAVLRWLQTSRLSWPPLLSLSIPGGLFLLYQYWAALTDPVLAGWNAQNQTPAPPLYDYLLAFSPALPLALYGINHLFKVNQGGGWRASLRFITPAQQILLLWFVIGLLLVYFPSPLQRRFSLGYFIPVVALAGIGVDALYQRYTSRARRLIPVLFALSLPTNFLILTISLFGVVTGDPSMYLSMDEARGLAWIRQSTGPRELVLASPDMGRFIPAFTGRRVLYGHAYETSNATMEEDRLERFFQSRGEANLPLERQVDYLFYGPRERLLEEEAGSPPLDLFAYSLAFEAGDVQIYAVQDQP